MIQLIIPVFIAIFSSFAWAQSNCSDLFLGVQSKEHLVELAKSIRPQQHVFIKDAPAFGYRITSRSFEDIPSEIRNHLGAIDQTKYTSEYLEQNIGSVFALQMNGEKADFYVIGKPTFDAKYSVVSSEQVAQKNAKYLARLMLVIPDLISAGDNNIVAVLKMSPGEISESCGLRKKI